MGEGKKPGMLFTMVVIVAGIAASSIMTFLFRGGASVESQLAQVARDLNKGLPAQMDEATRADRVTSGPDSLTLNYTFVKVDAASVDVPALVQQMRPNLVATLKTSPLRQRFAGQGVTVHYRYSDSHGVQVTDIAIPLN